MKQFITVSLVINSTFFTFNNKIYKQILLLWVPHCHSYLQMVLQDLEETIFKRIPSLPFYFRYVDDILFTAHKNDVQVILLEFNSYHPRIHTIHFGDGWE